MRGTDNAATPAEVNAEMVDVIDVDVTGEPGSGQPPATASLRTKQDHLYKVYRNKKEQTTTEWRLFNDAGLAVDQKAVASDAAGVTTKERIETGP